MARFNTYPSVIYVSMLVWFKWASLYSLFPVQKIDQRASREDPAQCHQDKLE